MAKSQTKTSKVKELAEKSRRLAVEDMVRNFDEQMSLMERGLGHMVWDMDECRVTTRLRPMPVTPKFEVSENDKELSLKVTMVNVPKDQIRVNVENKSVEVLACSDDPVCRPHYLSVDAMSALDPDSAKAKMTGNVLEVKVSKLKKKQLRVK